MEITFNLRRIKDDSLTLNDRIVFSLVWKWHWANQKRAAENKSPRAVSIRRIMRYTGYNNSTIMDSLAKLQRHGYLKKLVPIEGHHNLVGYYKLRLLAFTKHNKTAFRYFGGINRAVFGALADHELDRVHTTNWWRKVLGISKRTYYRWNKWLNTDDEGQEVHEQRLELEAKGFVLHA